MQVDGHSLYNFEGKMSLLEYQTKHAIMAP